MICGMLEELPDATGVGLTGARCGTLRRFGGAGRGGGGATGTGVATGAIDVVVLTTGACCSGSLGGGGTGVGSYCSRTFLTLLGWRNRRGNEFSKLFKSWLLSCAPSANCDDKTSGLTFGFANDGSDLKACS